MNLNDQRNQNQESLQSFLLNQLETQIASISKMEVGELDCFSKPDSRLAVSKALLESMEAKLEKATRGCAMNGDSYIYTLNYNGVIETVTISGNGFDVDPEYKDPYADEPF